MQTLFWRTLSAAQRATVLVCDLREAVQVSALHPFCRFHYDEVKEEEEDGEQAVEDEDVDEENRCVSLSLSLLFVCWWFFGCS